MIAFVNAFVFPAAFALLPPKLDTPAARALLLTIGLQESGFAARRQLAGGPARSLYQFELGGVIGVLTHRASKPHIARVLDALCYPPAATACFDAIEHNDVLATVCARLLLYTLPGRLPGPDEPELGWVQYLEAWRPGAPHRATWSGYYARAWSLVSVISQ